MNHHRYFAGVDTRTVECVIVGTGGFGRSFLAQARHVKGLNCRVAVDRDAATAAAVLASVGVTDIAECHDRASACAAWDAGRPIAVADLAIVADFPIDVVLEATGNPEAGARHARLAIEAGSPQGWHRYVGDRGDVLGVDRFGASAPGSEMLERYGFTLDNACARARALLGKEAG